MTIWSAQANSPHLTDLTNNIENNSLQSALILLHSIVTWSVLLLLRVVLEQAAVYDLYIHRVVCTLPVAVVFCLCRCSAVFITQPLDLIKNRMQLSGKLLSLDVFRFVIFVYIHTLLVSLFSAYFTYFFTFNCVCFHGVMCTNQCGRPPTKHWCSFK